MNRRFHTYTAYSVGAALVWAVTLIIVTATTTPNTRTKFLLVGSGWAIGWLSATIARAVYPPPKTHSRRSKS